MPKDYDSMGEAELLAEAKKYGVNFSLDGGGKLVVDLADKTLPAMMDLAVMARRKDIEQWLRDNPVR